MPEPKQTRRIERRYNKSANTSWHHYDLRSRQCWRIQGSWRTSIEGGGAKSWLAGSFRSHRSRQRGTYSGNDSLIFSTRLRLDFDYWRNRHWPARCHAGSNSRDYARRVARLWRSNARRIDETYAQFNLIAEPRSDCRSLARDRASRKTERCRGMSQLCARGNSARGGARTARAYFVLIGPKANLTA